MRQNILSILPSAPLMGRFAREIVSQFITCRHEWNGHGITLSMSIPLNFPQDSTANCTKKKKQNVPFPEGILLRLQHSSLSFNSCQILLSNCRTYVIVYAWETREPQGGLPSFFGGAYPPDERKEGLPMYITYQDLIQTGIFICSLIGLCYTIFKGRK